MEHRDDLKEQYCGPSKCQRDLLDMWWTKWKQQGFASLLPLNRRKKARRHADIKVGGLCLLSYDKDVYGP